MPKVVDHDARREQILDACFEPLARHGLGNLSIQQIAKAAGVSVGVLYHYFPDKEALLSALFQRVSARHAAEAEATGDLAAFLVKREDELRWALLVALDHRRLHPDAEGEVREALERYRRAVGDDRVFSSLLGALVWRSLDPRAPGPADL